MAKEYKINLSEMLGAMDRRNLDWYNNLDDDQKKDFEPWMAMRYCSSVDSNSQGIKEHYLIMTNELVNVGFGDISLKEHKELHWLCMRTVGIGKSVIHPFLKPPKKAKKNKYLFFSLIQKLLRCLIHFDLDDTALGKEHHGAI